MLQYYHDTGSPLTYACQGKLFKELNAYEKSQLTDRIISLHNCLDYAAIANMYGGDINNAIIAINANTGNEYDIPEDNDDYGVYRKMLKVAFKSGVDLKTCNFEKWPPEKLSEMIQKYSGAGFHKTQICKFLHIRPT